MKKILIAIIACLGMLSITSCKSQLQNVTFDQVNYELAGNWFFEKVGDTLINTPAGEEWPHLQFDTQTGKISGNVGCNLIMGNFKYNNQGGMAFENLGTTMMMCPQIEIEQKIILAMPEVTGYRFNSKTQELSLNNSQGQVLMVLTKIDPRTLLQYKQNY